MNRIKEYVPGFDCAKLLGSICIVAFHLFPTRTVSLPPVVSSAFSGVVPLFFLMSGYLMQLSIERKDAPLLHLRRYLLRYGLVYFSLNFLGYIIHYLSLYMATGVFMTKDFLLVMCTMPLWSGPLYQLWFIPSLMLGIWCSVHAFIRHKEKQWGLILIPLTIIILLFSTYNVPLFGLSMFSIPHGDLQIAPLRFTKGLVFAHLGMLMASRRKSLPSLPVFSIIALLVLLCENYLVERVFHIEQIYSRFTFSQIAFSLFSLRLLLCCPGKFLRNHHRFINRFTLLTFLLHTPQANLLRTLIPTPYGRMIVIIALNIALAYALPYLINRKSGVSHGL